MHHQYNIRGGIKEITQITVPVIKGNPPPIISSLSSNKHVGVKKDFVRVVVPFSYRLSSRSLKGGGYSSQVRSVHLMGNSVGGRKKVKIMKIDGETIKIKPPVQVRDVLKDYSAGYVLLESDSVRHFGIRASPLDPDRELKSKKLYFLVELPSFPEDNPAAPRRVRSGIQMSAKDRLECLMLSRRSISDMTMVRRRTTGGKGSESAVQVKMRIPRAELEKMVGESRDEVEVARKIVDLYYMGNTNGGGEISSRRTSKSLERKVSFTPMEEELGIGLSSW